VGAVIDADRVIVAIADRQRGVVTRRQLLAAGIDASAIDRRLRGRHLRAIHRGIYLVGQRVMADGAREVAALFACGRGAVVSHLSAANLHQPLLDLGAVVSASELERALAEAKVRRLVRRGDLLDQLERNRGRAGTQALREILELPGGPAPTRSEAERRLLRLVRSAGLPRPLVNTGVASLEVDVLWRDQQLVVEVDGFRFHSSRASFERDRARDGELAAAGYTVLRVTWRQLVYEPEVVVARPAAALAMRGSTGIG
jgi:very-short-patch-repair endonuclease